MTVLNFPASPELDSAIVEHDNAGSVDVVTGWIQDEGEPETRENSVVLLVSNEDHTFELARHLTPAEARDLAARLSELAEGIDHGAEVPC